MDEWTKLFIKPGTDFSGSMKCTNWRWMKCMKLVDLLRNLNMITAEIALSQFQEQKFCVSGETHVDLVVLAVRVMFVWLAVWYV